MNKHRGDSARRLRSVSPGADPALFAGEPTGKPTGTSKRETVETVLPGLPRVGALDALLRELDGLRLSLEHDLELAASALERGAPQSALDIIENERRGLQDFETSALGHLSTLADEVDAQPDAEALDPTVAAAEAAAESVAGPGWPRRRRRIVPAIPFAAAAAIVGFLMGVAPHTGGGVPRQINASAAAARQSLAKIIELAANGQTSGIRSAAAALHDQLILLVAEAGNDPAAAQQGLLLLASERAAITSSGDSANLGDVLAASNSLSALIFNALPVAVRTPTRPGPVTVPGIVPSPTRTPTASPSGHPTSAPTAAPTAAPNSAPTSAPAPPRGSAQASPPSEKNSPGAPPVLPPKPSLGG